MVKFKENSLNINTKHNRTNTYVCTYSYIQNFLNVHAYSNYCLHNLQAYIKPPLLFYHHLIFIFIWNENSIHPVFNEESQTKCTSIL